MYIRHLQSQLSWDVKSRYNISGQINSILSKIDNLQSNVNRVITTIESGASLYHNTENRLTIKAHQVGQPKHILDSSMAGVFGWIDDGRHDYDADDNTDQNRVINNIDFVRDLLENHRIEELMNELTTNQANYSEEEFSLIDKIIREFFSGLNLENFSINGAVDITGKTFEHADTVSVGIVSFLNSIKNMGRSNPGSSGFILISSKDAIRNTHILSAGRKISNFLQNGLDTPKLPPFIAKGVGTCAIPVIGSAIDFGLMTISGENVQDAAIKTVGHLAIGAATTNVGAAVGGFIGSFIPVPVVGTVVGAAAGIFVTTVACTAFDAIYDNKDEIVETIGEGINQVSEKVSDIVETSKKWVDNIGKSWASSWNNLGSVFG